MKARVLTAVALAPLVLGALFSAHPFPILLLAALAAYICGREISALLGHDSHVAGAICALAVVATPQAWGQPLTSALAWLALAFGAVSAGLAVKRRRTWLAAPSLLWCIAPFYSLLLLHQNQVSGLWNFSTPVLLAILPLWAGDTAAIFAGKAWGRHPLAPSISPKKTWEGAIANLIACVAAAYGIGSLIGVDPVKAILCGIAAGTLGQAGDLFESYIKRSAGVKDSGTLLPGHGGLMDRVDSILFTAPAVAFILLAWN